jgi:hypothetical protein
MTLAAMKAGTEALGRVNLAGQFTDEGPDQERYPGPTGWDLKRWACYSFLVKVIFCKKKKRPKEASGYM